MLMLFIFMAFILIIDGGPVGICCIVDFDEDDVGCNDSNPNKSVFEEGYISRNESSILHQL
jgi:hypothetical protein